MLVERFSQGRPVVDEWAAGVGVGGEASDGAPGPSVMPGFRMITRKATTPHPAIPPGTKSLLPIYTRDFLNPREEKTGYGLRRDPEIITLL